MTTYHRGDACLAHSVLNVKGFQPGEGPSTTLLINRLQL